MRNNSWFRGALPSALFFGLVTGGPALGQQLDPGKLYTDGNTSCDSNSNCASNSNKVNVTPNYGGTPGAGNPTAPGSGSGYEGTGMGGGTYVSQEEVNKTLTAVTDWEIVDTEDRCGKNFDFNDRLGSDHGGPNTQRPHHAGVDIQGDPGDAIYAWKGGYLAFRTKWDGLPYDTTNTACGHGVTINHIDGSKTWYCHLAALPRTSGWISAGDVVGRVGSTGKSWGPHVHVGHTDTDGNHAEYFDYTSDRPEDSELNPDGC